MGRDWYLGGDKSSKREKRGDRETTSSGTPGCMSAVFQLFDFHQFHPCFSQHHTSFQPQPCLHEHPIILKGVEAPRNSLESEEVFMAVDASISSVIKKEQENLNIPMGIQIKTNIDGGYSSESSYSPSTKTPNLVARLMGLDILPFDGHSHSPTSLSSSNYHPHGTPTPLRKSHLHNQISRSCRRTYSENDIIMGTRSLPETPRVSSERKSDVDRQHHHHRLSLQIIREKVLENDENRSSSSPSYYAKQIVKQVRESVIGRKVGLDITNTSKNRSAEEIRRDEHLLGIKVKKTSKKNLVKVVFGDNELSSSKHSSSTTPSSCSPRLRLLEHKNHHSITVSSPPLLSSSIPTIDNQSTLTKVSVKTKSQQLQEQQQQQEQYQYQQQQQQQSRKCIQKSKKVTGERFKSSLEKPVRSSEIIRRNKKEEQFVRPSTASKATYSDKKCSKKTPLSKDLLHVHTLLPVKKDPSPTATKLPQKQVAIAQEPKRGSQLSSSSSLAFKQEATHTPTARENNACIFDGRLEFQYVTKVLKRTGIDKDTQVSFTRWFSPSHPLDPYIFNYLESTIFATNKTVAEDQLGHQLGHRCNRRLIFNLVDEILVDILKPYINMKPWVWCGTPHSILYHDGHDMKGSHLIEKLCARIRSYPMANCEDLQDIDALVDKDLHEPPPPSSIAFEEEGESIVLDIEKDIVDSLVHETVVLSLYGGC